MCESVVEKESLGILEGPSTDAHRASDRLC